MTTSHFVKLIAFRFKYSTSTTKKNKETFHFLLDCVNITFEITESKGVKIRIYFICQLVLKEVNAHRLSATKVFNLHRL